MVGKGVNPGGTFQKLEEVLYNYYGAFLGAGIGAVIGLSIGKRKYIKYQINGNPSQYNLFYPDIHKDLGINPNLSVKKFKIKAK